MPKCIAKKEVEMNSIGDIMKGGISAILIALGYVVLWCGMICLIMSAAGMADQPTDIRWCGVGCLVFTVILMGSGIAWYYIVKPKT
jgi:hypothetical protein